MTTRIKQIMPAETGTRLAYVRYNYMQYSDNAGAIELRTIPVIGWALIEDEGDTYVDAVVNDGACGVVTVTEFDLTSNEKSIRVLSPFESLTVTEVLEAKRDVVDKYYMELEDDPDEEDDLSGEFPYVVYDEFDRHVGRAF